MSLGGIEFLTSADGNLISLGGIEFLTCEGRVWLLIGSDRKLRAVCMGAGAVCMGAGAKCMGAGAVCRRRGVRDDRVGWLLVIWRGYIKRVGGTKRVIQFVEKRGVWLVACP